MKEVFDMGGGVREGRKIYADERHQPNLPSYRQAQRSIGEYTKPRVFISFHIDDEAQINFLRHQAKNSDQLEFIDYSVKEPFDEKWKTQSADRIKRCSVMIVAIGEHTCQRPAVDWEIRKAHELGIPVIGMRIHSDAHDKVPQAMIEHGDKVVPWKLETIQSELDRARSVD